MRTEQELELRRKIATLRAVRNKLAEKTPTPEIMNEINALNERIMELVLGEQE
jgi:hypothetical protein